MPPSPGVCEPAGVDCGGSGARGAARRRLVRFAAALRAGFALRFAADFFAAFFPGFALTAFLPRDDFFAAVLRFMAFAMVSSIVRWSWNQDRSSCSRQDFAALQRSAQK